MGMLAIFCVSSIIVAAREPGKAWAQMSSRGQSTLAQVAFVAFGMPCGSSYIEHPHAPTEEVSLSQQLGLLEE